ncbi:MAG: cyclic nucleotide-binding domain-containing protein [Pedobacter sp.]|nr:MAG: cyclic nucleotide-binding domain-containing protein [Pedobacter sp.]
MKTILVIESDAIVRESYAETLKSSGYNVIIAQDGDIGINMAIINVPDLVLCNTALMDVDGFCVLAVLSKNLLTSHIPFIFINTKFKLYTLRRGMDMGADDFITRPFQDNQLVRAVEFRINKLKTTIDHSENVVRMGQDKIDNVKGIPNINEIILRGTNRRLKKKQTLYFENDHTQGLYFLDEGCLKTFRLNSNGRELITNLYHAKSFIGLGSLLLEDTLADTAEAMQNCSVYFFPKRTVLELLIDYPDLNQYFIKILSMHLRQKEDELIDMAYESVTKRLSKVLVRLNESTSPIDHIAVTRYDLAGLTGIATETVSRILSDFKHQNLIEKSGSHIHIIHTGNHQIK